MDKDRTPTPGATERTALCRRVRETRAWDLVVVGGGATGLGVAVDAALQGHRVLLLEAHDFAKGSSSRATKLLHGGVRYLAQGHLPLVREALRERRTVLRNAPVLARPLAFVMPAYRWWESHLYGWGLRVYEWLAGASSLGATERIGAAALRARLPQLREAGLRGGVRYWDGQFDDAGLAVALARTATRLGAVTLNHCRVERLERREGQVAGVHCVDTLSGEAMFVQARCVVNATGVWVDALRHPPTRSSVTVSQGIHLVVDRRFWPYDEALLIPRTRDGRVLFVVPWLGQVILGTTDTPRHDSPLEPRARADEIDFVLSEVSRYLHTAPTRADVKSVWAGLRPLVRPAGHGASPTRQISREHAIWIDDCGLLSVTGGKWTTYRAMAEDVLSHARAAGLLPATGPLRSTADLALTTSDAEDWQSLPGADRQLAPGLTEAQVRFAVRHAFACTVEDVLARRSRCLFLDARLARDIAPAVSDILRAEGIADPDLAGFLEMSAGYCV